MLGFKTFEYNPGNTDLFVDFSSDYQYIYFAPSEITYDANGYVIYDGYTGTSGPKNYLKNSNGTKYILDQNYIPVAIEVINDLSNGIQYLGNHILLTYDKSDDKFVAHLFDNDGYFKESIETPTDDRGINDAENLFNIDFNDDGIKGIFDSFNITVDIDYASFDRFGITKDLYEPYIKEAVDIFESIISRGLPDVAAGDSEGIYGPVARQPYNDGNLDNGENIDDLNILFKAHQYDDALALGDAVITEIRLELDEQGEISKVGLPSQGTIRFGSDISIYEDYDITALTVHEIAHVLGFGILWYGEDYGLGDTPAPWNQYGEGNIINQFGDYVGTYALEAYSEISGVTKNFIPVEQSTGREGSDYYHWNQDEFIEEIMSYVQYPNQELSTITINSLKDIGYDLIDFEDSANAQLVTYISNAIKQENDFMNEIFMASSSDEDQTNIKRIL
jgi:hypothetical protein